jgi:hypothetical protein
MRSRLDLGVVDDMATNLVASVTHPSRDSLLFGVKEVRGTALNFVTHVRENRRLWRYYQRHVALADTDSTFVVATTVGVDRRFEDDSQ